jgi:hypothetical protein
MSNRANGGNVAAQQNHRQRRDGSDKRQEPGDGSGMVKPVELVQQDDRHRPASGPYLLGKPRKPMP